MRRPLTVEQQQRREERHQAFRALWKRVAAMPELERVQLTAKHGIVTVEGHQLSLANQMLIVLQIPAPSVVGGFRQWIKQGRAVRKGQHGAMIWCPAGARKEADGATAPNPAPQDAPTEDNDRRFIIGTVFDISQTDELQTA
jgi:hypothetical protein